MSGALTRAEIAEAITYEVGLSQLESGDHVDTMFDIISDALVNGDDVKLTRLGTFQVREKKARVGRNPKTMIEAKISARKVVSFRPSLILKKALNESTQS